MLVLPEAPAIIHTEVPDVLLVELSTPKDDVAYFNGVQTSTAHLQVFEPGIAAEYTSIDAVREARKRAREAGKARFGVWALSAAEIDVLGNDLDDAVRDGARPGRFAGSTNARAMDATGEIRIGYWRIEEQLRKGCMTIAVRALAARYSSQGLLTAHVLPDNRDSSALLERVGFRPSGVTVHEADGSVENVFILNPA